MIAKIHSQLSDNNVMTQEQKGHYKILKTGITDSVLQINSLLFACHEPIRLSWHTHIKTTTAGEISSVLAI
jgi:hypothetical protein